MQKKELEYLGVQKKEMAKIAKKILSILAADKILLMKGNLGAGKTTLTKDILANLGIKNEVQSPTFGLVISHKLQNGTKVHHFDCYRLNSLEEALDIGIDEYFTEDDLCIVEWPEVIAEIIPHPYTEVEIKHAGLNKRDIWIKKII